MNDNENIPDYPDYCAECEVICEGNSKHIEELDATYCYFEEPDGSITGCYYEANKEVNEL